MVGAGQPMSCLAFTMHSINNELDFYTASGDMVDDNKSIYSASGLLLTKRAIMIGAWNYYEAQSVVATEHCCRRRWPFLL